MKDTISHIVLTILAALAMQPSAHCQEKITFSTGEPDAQHRLFPGLKPKTASKDEMMSTIDSLNAVIEALRQEISSLDSVNCQLEADMRSQEVFATEEEESEFTTEKTDSLLNMWYLQNQISRQVAADCDFSNLEDIASFDSDSVRLSSNVPDSVLVERLKKMNSYITLPFNETVKNYMVLYTEKNSAKMKRILSLCDYYMPLFEEVFNRYDMPVELKYMAVIESALNPVARSRAGAYGIWQFMYRTGKQYGLNINSYVDERLDVEKAADAAARYLKDAYNIFGDWTLAISSYNCGAGNVFKAIKRSGGKRDFWSIYPYLPRETRGYMPAFVGAMYGVTYHKEYGIEPNPSPMPAHADTFMISRNLHFKQINELVGVPLETIREMNPQYLHDIIPGNEKAYVLKLPYNYTNAFLDCQDSLYTHMVDSLMSPAILKNIEAGLGATSGEVIRYKVKNGDYLGRIASRYHVTVKQIMNWNGLRSNNIRPGQILKIYTKGSAPAATTSTASQAKTQSGSNASSSGSGEYTIYTVKAGDSLYNISKKFSGVSVNEIMSLNNCTSSIKAGQKLKIPKK